MTAHPETMPAPAPGTPALMTAGQRQGAPAVSVLLSNFNHGRYLRQCLAGIQRQTLRDFEVVLTDDGSTDDSPAIIAEAARSDPRIRVNYFPTNRGVMAANEDTWSRARGRLIFGHGADDFIVDARFFERAVQALAQHPEAAGFYGIAGLFSGDTEKLVGGMGSSVREGFVSPSEFYPAFLRGQAFVPGASSIWRRELVAEFGGYDPALGPQIDFLANHLLPSRHGVVFAKAPMSCQRVYAAQSNYGSKTTLWEAAARYAKVEERMRAVVPAYEGMEDDWRAWRARLITDVLRKSGGQI